MSVKDMIKRSILDSAVYNQSMSLGTYTTIVVDMILAVVIGYIIYRIYKRYFTGVVYSRQFAITLMGMTALTCMVTLAISTNIVISLGMVGALSIVRYRTAVKEPLDIMYLFWAITEGITIGASMYILAAMGMVIMLFIVMFMNRTKDGQKAYVLVIHYADDAVREKIDSELSKIAHSVKSCIMSAGRTELTVQVDAAEKDVPTQKIRDIAGVGDVTLVSYNGEYHG